MAEAEIPAGVIRLGPGVRERLAEVDTVVFDIDGVLLDVSRSIRTVNCLSVPAYLRTLPGWSAPDDLLTSADIERFKEAGGFNDDWDLTYAAVLLYLLKAEVHGTRDALALHPLWPTVEEYTAGIAARGGWLAAAEEIVFGSVSPDGGAHIRAQYDPDLIRRLFQELWGGDLCPRLYGFSPIYFPGPGWIRLDRPLVDPALVPADRWRIGVLTGRRLEEAQVALELAGLSDRVPLPSEQGITSSDGFLKPEPWGMRELLTRLGSRTALYIGDTVDDLRTVLAFRRLPEAGRITLLSAQALTGTTPPEIAPELFAEADLIVADVNAALRLLTSSR